LQHYYADLHIHLGHAAGRPVKISASRRLTLQAIAEHAATVKGMHVLGIIDACCRGALADLEEALRHGVLTEQPDGAFRYRLPTADGRTVVLVPGCETEIREPGQPAVHWLAYFGGIAEVRQFAAALWASVRNPWLSTQRTGWRTAEFVERVTDLGGIALPAHAFTPHKGLFGAAVSSLAAVLPDRLATRVQVIELGLSADSAMADQITELHSRTFVSNSDAHSLDMIGREHNRLWLAEPSFAELKRAIVGEDGRAVTGNFGLDPRLGKYYRTVCLRCGTRADGPPPQLVCPVCGSDKVVKGVQDRLSALADRPLGDGPPRPPYVPQVPLRMLPGLGPRRLARLTERFGSELAVLHEVPEHQLLDTVEPHLASLIIAARTGNLAVEPGGGGVYGRVRRPEPNGT
jgi:uncharacterized protein (TIGR00375 family)